LFLSGNLDFMSVALDQASILLVKKQHLASAQNDPQSTQIGFIRSINDLRMFFPLMFIEIY
jgi:hypothetical protein